MSSPIDRMVDPQKSERRRRLICAMGAAAIGTTVAGCLGNFGVADDADDADIDDADDELVTDDDDDGVATFSVNGLDPTEITIAEVDRIDEVSAQVTNTGDARGTQTVELRIEDDVLDDIEVTLDAFDQTPVSFTDVDPGPREPGDHSFGIFTDDDGLTGTLTIEAMPELESIFEWGSLEVTSGQNTIGGTLSNTQDFIIENITVDLTVPENWKIIDESGTSVAELGRFESETVTWDVDVTAGDDLEVIAMTAYQTAWSQAEFEHAASITILDPLEIPFGMDCGGSHSDETVEIDGLVFEPSSEVSQEIDTCENRPLTDDEIWWPVQVDIQPNPNVYSDGCAFAPVENTEYDVLYQTEHWADGELQYTFLVANGTYDVRLHFAEIGGDNERIFDVSVQDETVLEMSDDNITLADLAGGTNTAYVVTVEGVEVSDQELTIDAESTQENPKFSAIEIRAAADEETISPGTTMVVEGYSDGWVGNSPTEIEAEKNPTLVLSEDEEYELGWVQGDGFNHNIEIVDNNDEVVDGHSTSVTNDPDGEQFLTFTATEEMAQYVCRPHAGGMRADIVIR